MPTKVATVDTDQGDTVATLLETPNKNHEYEILVDGDSEPLNIQNPASAHHNKAEVNKTLSETDIEENVRAFLEENGHSEADSKLVVNILK